MQCRQKRVPWAPRDYQKKAVAWLVSHPEAALLLDPGLGKTSSALKAFQIARDTKMCTRALVIAPRRVCYEVWTQEPGGEIAKWTDFRDLKVTLLHGSKKDARVSEDADLYVINPGGLKWLIEKGHLKGLLRRGVDTLLVDELSNFKHSNTQRFKLIKPYLSKFRRRWGLTGSPAPNGMQDLFGQVYTLDLGSRLGRYVTHFRSRYFDMGVGYGQGRRYKTYALREGAEEEIYEAIDDLALSMRAVDHLDLPGLVEQDIYVTLPDQARRVYDELEKEFIASIDGEVVTAANAAVVGGKCRQVASGAVYTHDLSQRLKDFPAFARRAVRVHGEKAEALSELVGELQGRPLLVAYEYEHDLDQIRGALGDVPAINGATPDAQARKFIRRWNAGELPILCGHPAAMAHGLNLQSSGHHVAWFTLTWNYEHYDQLNRRVWRQGQRADRVFVYRILARNTLDERVARVIHTKRRKQDSLMAALRKDSGS